jgi:conjugative transposon TraM protein
VRLLSEVAESFLSALTDSTFTSGSDAESDAMDALEALHRRYFPNEPSIFSDIDFNDNNNNRQPRNAQEEEMREMREQITMLQMMMLNQQLEKENEKEEEIEETEPEILTASKADSRESNAFNTIKANKKEMFISAIIDEAQTVVNGSRIRIRLMDDIFIGDYLFKRGSYLYGLVTGFSAQRVKVTVSTVLYGDRILKMRLSVYDNDGIQGLYVPASDFREMMQVAGSRMAQSSNVSISSNQNPYQQLMSQMGQDFYRSATSAVSARIRQNKAKLKYSSIIYLVNEDANSDNF